MVPTPLSTGRCGRTGLGRHFCVSAQPVAEVRHRGQGCCLALRDLPEVELIKPRRRQALRLNTTLCCSSICLKGT